MGKKYFIQFPMSQIVSGMILGLYIKIIYQNHIYNEINLKDMERGWKA